MTEFREISLRGSDADEEVTGEAATVLGRDGILVHPTGTLYGLGAATAAGDGEIARLKGREPGRPLLRIAGSVDALREAHPRTAWDDRAARLAACFWPGRVTLVLEDGTAEGLAVRVVSHPVTRAVLERLGSTMSSTSVNRTGEAAARSPDEVREVLGKMADARAPVLFLNAGSSPSGRPSTLVSLREDPPRLVRAGAVARDEIERCLGSRVEAEG